MNNLYKEIIIDGKMLNNNSSNCFSGIGTVLDFNSVRFLSDYKFGCPEAYQEIIELLFRKKYGMALSHIRIVCDPYNKNILKSYGHSGFMIAADALKINPDITIELCFLNNSKSDFAEKYNKYKNILDKVYEKYSIKADYISIGGEADSVWIKYLKDRLENEKISSYDFGKIKIAVSGILAKEMTESEILRKSVDAIYVNGKINENINYLNKKFQKEIWYRGEIAPCNAPELAVNADGIGISGENSVIDLNGTLNGVFNDSCKMYEYRSALSACYSFNDNLFGNIIRADRPWSGYYKIQSGLWGAAHITHFVQKDWKILYSVNEELPEDYSVFVSDEGDYTVVFANNSDKPRKYSICLRNIEKADAFIHCVETKGPESSDNYSVNWFRVVDKIIPVKKNYGFCYTLEVKPFSIMTCTTLSVEHVNGTDTVRSLEFKNEVLSLPYSDSFNYRFELSEERKNVPYYTMDLCGSFEIFSNREDNVLIQTATKDMAWEENNLYPVTIIGDDSWTNYSVKIEVKLEDTNDINYAGIGLRCQFEGQTAELGYQLRIFSDRRWQLKYMDNIIEEDVADDILYNEWNSLKISADGKRIKCYINKMLVCEHVVCVPLILSGRVGIYSNYCRNMFRNLTVNPIMGSSVYSINHDCLDGEFSYSENWIKNIMDDQDFYNRTSVSTDIPDEYFEFDFSGESIALIGKAEDLRLKIEIDDKIMAAGLFIGNCGAKEVFYSRGKLENTEHKLKLIVLSGKLEFNGAQTFISGHHILSKSLGNGTNLKKSEKGKTLKKSTVLFGAGLAAAGAGIFLIRKKLKDGKNKK